MGAVAQLAERRSKIRGGSSTLSCSRSFSVFSTSQRLNFSTTDVLIINADDWGRSAAETDAALSCFKERRITSASAMVYMSDSERAARLAGENALNIGLHLNFSEPFSGSRFPEGLTESHNRIVRYLKGNKYAQLIYNPFLGNAFVSSFQMQCDEFVRLYGKTPAHIDGHHHMHLCANVLLSNLIPSGIRVRRNFSFCPGEKSWLNRMYRRAIDRRLERNYLVTDYFFDLTTSLEQRKLDRVVGLARSTSVELMTHPINQSETDYLLGDEFCGILQELAIQEPVVA